MQTSNISCKACIGVMNTFSFCLSVKLFISPSIWNDNFACRSFLVVGFFLSAFWAVLSQSSLTCEVSAEKQAGRHTGAFLWPLTSNSSLGRLLLSLFSSFSEGLFCFLSWNITIRLLILPSPAYFFVLVRLVISPALGDMTLYRRCFLGPSSILISGHYSHMLQGLPYVGCMNFLLCWGQLLKVHWWVEQTSTAAGCKAIGVWLLWPCCG